jgi:hypothetical protein
MYDKLQTGIPLGQALSYHSLDGQESGRAFVQRFKIPKSHLPCTLKARIEEDKGGLLGDVYKWVLTNDAFLQWQDDHNRLLWIRGDPGKGKTMLLCGIVDELEKGGGGLSYFFCQATITASIAP